MVAQSSKPTICHLVHSLCVGGAETLAARLARWFAPRYRIVFACLDSLGTLGDELQREGFKTHVLQRRPGFDWRCAARLAQVLRSEHVDVVHAHQYTPFFYALLGRGLARQPAILFTEHGRHFPDRRRPKRVLANRLLMKRCDRVVGVGEAVRQALVANEGIPPERVGVVLNGIDLSAYRVRPECPTGVRREIGVSDDDFMILQVARLDSLKDHPTALRALKKVAALLPNVRLVLAGDGPQRPEIERLVSELELASHVRLLGTRRDVANLLAATDVFLLTSVSEGIPLTVIEAMAAGVPVVATDVGGVGELVGDGTTGFLAPAGDDERIADSILRLARHPEWARGLGRAAADRAREEFAEERMHASYDRLYREMSRA
jgi:glycosyltransferase involved in cell wall biosynthesis